MIGVHAAVNHSNPSERVSAQEGLELYTINAARIAFQETDRGSLEAGKLGDFVVLAEDPLEVDQSHIVDIPVEMTVIGGNVVYQRAQAETINQAESSVWGPSRSQRSPEGTEPLPILKGETTAWHNHQNTI